ncbi:hypothetical protein Aperf_G00000004074 [Anoplocephala perfoliata]
MSIKSVVPLLNLRHDLENTTWNEEGQSVRRQMSRRVTFKETVTVSGPRTVFRRSPARLRKPRNSRSQSITSHGSSTSSSGGSRDSSSASSRTSTFTSESSTSTAMFRSSSDTSSGDSDDWEEEFRVFNIIKHSISWDVSSKLINICFNILIFVT